MELDCVVGCYIHHACMSGQGAEKDKKKEAVEKAKKVLGLLLFNLLCGIVASFLICSLGFHSVP